MTVDNHQQLVEKVAHNIHFDHSAAAAQQLLIEDAKIADPSKRSRQIQSDIQQLKKFGVTDDDLKNLGFPVLLAQSSGDAQSSGEQTQVEKASSVPENGRVIRTEKNSDGTKTEILKVPGYEEYEVTPGLGHSYKKRNADGSVTEEIVKAGDGMSNRKTTSKDGSVVETEYLDPSTGTPTGSTTTQTKHADGSVTTDVRQRDNSFRTTSWPDGTIRAEDLDFETGKLTGKGKLYRHGKLIHSWGPKPGDNN